MQYLFWALNRDDFRRDLNELQEVLAKSRLLSVFLNLFQSHDDLYRKL